MNNPITVSVIVHKPLSTVWDSYTLPEHITQWNFASDDWECPTAKNDLRVGGEFSSRMAAKDGSVGFDMGGTYTEVEDHKKIAYDMGDRAVEIIFTEVDGGVEVSTRFEPESENPREMQQGGWQAILDNFKKHTESLA